MANIIHSVKYINFKEGNFDKSTIKENLREAIRINESLIRGAFKVAYFFIDPLMNSFEAANNFYFNLLNCASISRINTYRSGASPIQALSDAKELIDNNLYDAVFIFGYDPLNENKKKYGKDEFKRAMNIFEEKPLIECYNELAHRLSEEMGLTKEQFLHIADELYENYYRTYIKRTKGQAEFKRGPFLDDINADYFRLSDCANPNIDFVGGVILANEKVADFLLVPLKDRINVSSASYRMVEGIPGKISEIVGYQDNIFPHLKEALAEAELESKIDLEKVLRDRDLLLEVYTCYPPIPLAFLIVTGLACSLEYIDELLKSYEVTITGGMNFARAPWNNPALNGLIDMYQLLTKGDVPYGLVHGNGGIGEVQGIAILSKNL